MSEFTEALLLHARFLMKVELAPAKYLCSFH